MGPFRRHGGSARRAVCLLLASPLLLTPAYSGASSATAAEPGPGITSPTAGEQVGGEIQVTVESTAPYVLVAWGPEAGSGGVSAVETRDGVATAALSTSGYTGPTTIVARECQNPCAGDDPSSAVPAETSVQVDVSNPAPQWEEQAWLDEIHGDAGLWGVRQPWASYGFSVDGEPIRFATLHAFAEIDAEQLGDGAHTVQMAHCNQLSARYPQPPVCDVAHATEPRTFVVRTALHPTIDAVRPRTISPNGDGVADAARVTMTTDSSQVVVWALMRASQAVATGDLEASAPRRYTFDVDGLDAEDSPLASGTYTLRVHSMSSATCPNLMPTPGVDARCVFGEASTTLEVDLDAPAVTGAAATPAVFRPRVRHHVRFTAELREPAKHLRVRLLRGDTVVRRLWLGPRPAGSFSATWDGLRRNGEPMRAGTYRYQFLTQDRVGNAAIRSGGTFEVRSTR